MTSRKRTETSADPAAEAAGVAVGVPDDPAEDEAAVDVTPPYAFRYHQAVEFLTGLTNGTMEMVEDELLSVFGRGEFTAFVFRRNRSHIIVPEYDEETEAMPYAENDEPRILQTTARFTAHNNGWSYGAGPRTSLLEYGD